MEKRSLPVDKICVNETIENYWQVRAKHSRKFWIRKQITTGIFFSHEYSVNDSCTDSNESMSWLLLLIGGWSSSLLLAVSSALWNLLENLDNTECQNVRRKCVYNPWKPNQNLSRKPRFLGEMRLRATRKTSPLRNKCKETISLHVYLQKLRLNSSLCLRLEVPACRGLARLSGNLNITTVMTKIN